MRRRTFLLGMGAAVVLAATGVRLSGSDRPKEGLRYLSRDPGSGVWGISRDPRREEGVWVRHPSGVLGIGSTTAAPAAIMVVGDGGVVGFRAPGSVESS